MPGGACDNLVRFGDWRRFCRKMNDLEILSSETVKLIVSDIFQNVSEPLGNCELCTSSSTINSSGCFEL